MHIGACERPHKHLLPPNSKDRRGRHAHRTEGWDPLILFYDRYALRCVTGKEAVVPLDGRVQIARAVHPLKGRCLLYSAMSASKECPPPPVHVGQSWLFPLENEKRSSSPYSIHLTCHEPHLLQKGSAVGWADYTSNCFNCWWHLVNPEFIRDLRALSKPLHSPGSRHQESTALALPRTGVVLVESNSKAKDPLTFLHKSNSFLRQTYKTLQGPGGRQPNPLGD